MREIGRLPVDSALGTHSLTVEGKDLFRSDLLEGDFRVRAWS
jgi:hypothetical protein